MNSWTISLAIGLFLLWSLQAGWIFRFTQHFYQWRIPKRNDAALPKAAVLLTVRGVDPFLEDCLHGILNQDYPQYDVRIVLDNESDPAWEVVRRTVRKLNASHATIRVIERRHDTCSLKLSGLLQELSHLDDTYGAVVFLDADVVAYPDWLREMVSPLSDPQVGATTGIRWYLPSQRNWGTLVRYVWNSGAIVQMFTFRIGWGGSLAFRADLFRKSDLLQHWKKMLWEDTLTFDFLRSLGLKLEIVPVATMVNREQIGLGACFRFIRRQMLNVRLYHSRWPLIAAFGLGSTVWLGSSLAYALWRLIAGDWVEAAWATAALGGYFVGIGLLLVWQQIPMNSVIAARGESPVAVPIKAALAGPLTLVVFLACLISAMTIRRIEWRGITYKLYGPRDIRLVEYRPFQPAREESAANVSIC